MNDEAQGAYPELLALFRRFDANDDGRIDESEFRKLLIETGNESSEEVFSLQFALIDENYDGLVDFEEFVGWWNDYR
jgi:calmodulin